MANLVLRRFLVLLCGLVCFAGCGERSRQGENSTRAVELTYWPAPNAQEVELADSLVSEWNRLHPAIRVIMQPIPVSQSTEEVLLAAIAGKTTPDICSNIWPGALLEYTQAGGLVALDQFEDFEPLMAARTPPELLSLFRSTDGHYYQIPWKTNPVMMFYNQDLLTAAGISQVPRTYSEYLSAGSRVTRDVDGDGSTDVWMGERDIRPIWWQRMFDFYPFYIAASSGKTLFQQGDVAFENSTAAGVFEFFQQCYSRRIYPRTFFQGGDPFLLGKKATHFGGPWQVAAIEKFAPGMHYGVVPIPVPDSMHGPVYTSGDYKNIAVFSTTRHPREAWEFVKFLVRAESDRLLLEITRQMPVRGDLLSNPLFRDFFARNPVMTAFARQAPYTRSMDTAPDLKEIFDAIAQAYESCAVYGRETPEQAVKNAADHTRLIVEWNR